MPPWAISLENKVHRQFNQTCAMIFIDRQKRPIQGCAKLALLVGINPGIRETQQQLLDFARELHWINAA